MKGFFRWFKSSTKMKRWILLLVIGIVLACYGMARVLVAKTFDFKEIAVIRNICYRICMCNFRNNSYAKKNIRTFSARVR